MIPLFGDLADEDGGARFNALAEVLELGGSDFGTPSRFQGAEAWVEFGRVRLAPMALGVALQVDDAELDVGLREEAPGHGQQTGEVVVDDQQDAPQTPFDQAAKDVFPLLDLARWRASTSAAPFPAPNRASALGPQVEVLPTFGVGAGPSRSDPALRAKSRAARISPAGQSSRPSTPRTRRPRKRLAPASR